MASKRNLILTICTGNGREITWQDALIGRGAPLNAVSAAQAMGMAA